MKFILINLVTHGRVTLKLNNEFFNIMSKLIELLQHFGLSANAAKAYVALLKYNPATGYEIPLVTLGQFRDSLLARVSAPYSLRRIYFRDKNAI